MDRTNTGASTATSNAPINGMSVAALVFGILAIPLNFLFLGFLFAGLSMTFAFLSRGAQRMNGLSMAGFICSLVSFLPALLMAGILLFQMAD